jgi:hypothetical protein
LRIPCVFEIVVADRKFCIGFLDVGVVNDTDIATTKDGPFIWITCDGKLGEIEVKLFSQIDGEDERVH